MKKDFVGEKVILPDMKKIMVTILLDFHSFCKKNNLKYSIWYGTAIGAIRHKGFIPWDDDVDVVMPRDDYNFFCDNYHSDEFELVTDKAKNYKLPYGKICSKDTYSISKTTNEHFGVFIDVFPLDLVNKTKLSTEKLITHTVKLACGNCLPPKFQYPQWNKKTKFIFLRKIKYIFTYPFYYLKSIFMPYWYHKRKTLKLLKDSSGEYFLCGVCHGEERYYLDKYFFDDMLNIPFENINVLISSCYDRYLKERYGDYMKIPPIEERQNHSYYSFYYLNKIK